MEIPVSQLPTAPIGGKHVLVRIDCNIPRTKSGRLVSDFKLKAILPTLQLIKMREGKMVLIGHSGRPEGRNPEYSLEPLVNWFKKHEFSTTFAPTPEAALTQKNLGKHDIIILENVRFFPGEETRDLTFAKKLAQLGDYFVQDAFGVLHRDHTSMTLLAEQFEPNKKTIGLLVEKELKILSHLATKPQQPFILILGGSKPQLKLPIVEHLLDKISALLVCPALAFTFMKAQGKGIGRSSFDQNALTSATQIIKKAEQEGIDIILPVDFMVTTESFEKPTQLTLVKKLTPDHVGVSFGPETAALFKHCISQARTIFLNGMSGNISYPETLEGMRTVFSILQHTYATKIIGGGDAVATAQLLGFDQTMGTFLTGGGATLAYLSGKRLPGLLSVC